jgi:hypothetical protein
MNKFIWIGLFLGSTLGGFIPTLWGAGSFSTSGVLLSAIGGFAGLWLGLKANQSWGG